MGCDIHGWIEVKVKNKWIAYLPLPEAASGRVYKRFALLASVRGESDRVPAGLPSDVSDTVAYHAYEWEADAHSHSHMSASEFLEVCMKTYRSDGAFTRWELQEGWPWWKFLEIENTEAADFDPDNYRVVFWFDN